MTIYGSVRIDPVASRDSGLSRHAWIGSRWAQLLLWLRTCADYYDAAAEYEQLRRLSDAELNRRGLQRDTLARDLCDRRRG
jgi:hypothetical protein